MEEISACVGLSLGITASKENLDLGVTLTHSDCKQKGLLNTGTAAGQGSLEAPWSLVLVTWAQRFVQGHTRCEEGSSGAIPQTRWEHRNFGFISPGVLMPLKRAGINVAISGTEAVGWLGGCSPQQ